MNTSSWWHLACERIKVAEISIKTIIDWSDAQNLSPQDEDEDADDDAEEDDKLNLVEPDPAAVEPPDVEPA